MGELLGDVLLHDGALHAFGDVRRHRHHALGVDAVDVADALRRHTLDEVADRHRAGRSLDPQFVDLTQAAPLFREANDNVDRLVSVGRAILRHLDAIGDELHRGADGVDVGAIFGGLRLVDLELPVDAGQRQTVVEIADCGHLREDAGDLLRRGRQLGGIERRELHLDRLAGRRAGAWRRHLDQDAGDVPRLLADLVHDHVRRRPRLPVGELELDDADRVFGDLVRALRLLADTGVDGLQAFRRQHGLLDLAQRRVLLVERDVAAPVHDDLAVIGLDRGEEFDAVAEFRIGADHRDQQKHGREHRLAGMRDRRLDGAHVEAALAGAVVVHDNRRTAEQSSEGRREEQRYRQRGRQGRDQGDRHVFHELADHARPEQKRRERRDARQSRRDHRAGHATRCSRVGELRRHALGHAPLGIFGDDDGVVDQHADREDQREQHDDVDREARKLEAEDAGEERRRNGNADKQRRAEAEREQDDHGDEQHAGRDRVLEVRQHLPDQLRLVLRIADVHAFRPVGLEPLDDLLHRVDRLDQVGAGALRHLDGHGRLAVDAGDRSRVLEGRLDGGDIAERHRGAGRRRDRDREHVLRPLDQARHLDREAASLPFQSAGGDDAVGGLRHRHELVERDAVALHEHGLGGDLDRLVTRAAQLGLQDTRRLLDGVLGVARQMQHRALRHVAGERHDQHRIEREVDLLHRRLVGVLGQVVLGLVDLGADVGERGVGVEAGLKLEQHVAAALKGGGAHFLDVADGFELRLDRPQQQTLGILRADAALGQLHVDNRHLDVGLGLLGDRHIGDEARDQEEGQRGERQPRVLDSEGDEAGH